MGVVPGAGEQRPSPGHDRVLDLEDAVGLAAGGAGARLHEALLEVVREESVEDGVDGWKYQFDC